MCPDAKTSIVFSFQAISVCFLWSPKVKVNNVGVDPPHDGQHGKFNDDFSEILIPISATAITSECTSK